MNFTVRQRSDLMQGNLVSERKFSYEEPADIIGVLRLILSCCSDFLRDEGIVLSQDSIELKRITLEYPGLAGILEVILGDTDET